MVLAAPELVIAELVELLDEVEVPAELQHRMLANRMMRGKEGAEFQTWHHGSPIVRWDRLSSRRLPACCIHHVLRSHRVNEGSRLERLSSTLHCTQLEDVEMPRAVVDEEAAIDKFAAVAIVNLGPDEIGKAHLLAPN